MIDEKRVLEENEEKENQRNLSHNRPMKKYSLKTGMKRKGDNSLEIEDPIDHILGWRASLKLPDEKHKPKMYLVSIY